MANEPEVTITGNLTADPELRFTPSGAAVANFTVAQTPSTLNRETNQWTDGETIFMRCSAWRGLAENVAESLHRGDRVVVKGRLKSRTFTHEGNQRTVMEMDADDVGASLKMATAQVRRAQRGAPAQGQQQQAQQPAGDPWATGPGSPAPSPQQAAPAQQAPAQQAPAAQGGGWPSAPGYDEPPF